MTTQVSSFKMALFHTHALADNKNNYKSLDEFEFRQDPIADY